MIVDKFRKTVAIAKPNVRNLVRIFSNNLEKTSVSDNFHGNYRVVKLSPTLFKEKNLSKEEVKKLHGVILEAFEHLCDPKDKESLKYLNFNRFKGNLNSFYSAMRGNKHFLIKDKDSNIVGFYQYAHKSNNLYIQSIVIPKVLRNTSKAPTILKAAINNILKEAKKRNYKKITLHVDASNKPLIKSYERFGFKITKEEKDFYLKDFPAYYMEADISHLK